MSYFNHVMLIDLSKSGNILIIIVFITIIIIMLRNCKDVLINQVQISQIISPRL